MNNSIYIYGAGNYGIACYKQYIKLGFIVKAFVVTKQDNNPIILFSVPVIGVEELLTNYKSELIILALHPKYQNSVIKLLRDYRITNYQIFNPCVIEENILPKANAIARECIKYKKIYIYGAGYYGKECYRLLKNFAITITAFVVTNKEGAPSFIEDVPVKSINDIKNDKKSLFILALKYTFLLEVKHLLKNLSISNYLVYSGNVELIKFNPDPFFEYIDMISSIRKFGGQIYNDNLLTDVSASLKDKVLIVNHRCDLTGAPMAGFRMAEIIRQQGKIPIIISPLDGGLRETIIENNIVLIVFKHIYNSNFILKIVNLFDYVVINTLLGYPLIKLLNGNKKNICWWIHEAGLSYSPGLLALLPHVVSDNIRIYCGGSWAKKMLKKYLPELHSKQLLYYCPDNAEIHDFERKFQIDNPKKKYIFAIIGTISTRKRQDTLCNAISLLPPSIRLSCLFYFIGTEDVPCPEVSDKITETLNEFPESIRRISYLTPKELIAFYNQMDCLVCSSIDDPMPIVVTDAFSLSKVVICSENTGSASLINKYSGGYIYHNNAAKELAELIKIVYKNRNNEKQKILQKNARTIYEKYFSKKVFNKNIKKMFLELDKKKD